MLARRKAHTLIRGSWWSHPAGKLAFQLTRAIRDSSEVLVCRLVEGKVTYVHRRLWPALVRLSSSFDEMRLARVREVHSASGAHKIVTLPYPDWVTTETHTLARKLSEAEARRMLGLSADGQTLVVRPIKPHTHSTG